MILTVFVCVRVSSLPVQRAVRSTMKSQGDQRTELHPLQVLLHQDARGVHRLDGAGGWGRPGVYRHVVGRSAEKTVAVSRRASFRSRRDPTHYQHKASEQRTTSRR